MPLKIGQKLFDNKYTIVEKIYSGGFHIVYKAEDSSSPKNFVAIKVLNPNLPEELSGNSEEAGKKPDKHSAIRRFEREMMLDLSHPKIVKTILSHEIKGIKFIVMDYMPGGNLAEKLEANRGGIPIDQAIQIARDICDALDYLHNHRWVIIHRDIKPQNILFDKADNAKLSDFGIVQLTKDPTTYMSDKTQPGTIAYMAPETQNPLEYLKPAADIFSLGAVLFEMLTGKPYKDSKDYKHSPTPSKLRFNIPPELDAVVLKAVAENPKERYQTAKEFDAALKKIRNRLAAIQRKRVQQEWLAQSYSEVQDAMQNEDWQSALEFCEEILKSEEAYKDVLNIKKQLTNRIALEEIYRQLKQTIDGEDWQAALKLCAEIKATDPGFRDVADLCREAAEHQKHARAAELYQTLQIAKKAKQWERITNICAELEALGFNHPKIAREKATATKQVELEEKYRRLIQAVKAQKWQKALNLCNAIENIEPNYRELASYRAEIKKQRDLEAFYDAAQFAVQDKDWAKALTIYADIEKLDVNYRDVPRLKEFAAAELEEAGKATEKEDQEPADKTLRPQKVTTTGYVKNSGVWVGLGILAIVAVVVISIAISEIYGAASALSKSSPQISPTATANATATTTAATPNPVPPNMVFVPAGEFTMGSNDGDDDEQPVHTVYLDAFYIDKYEVTNAQFAEFLNAKDNQSEGGTMWLNAGNTDTEIHQYRAIWQADNGYEDHPVIEVTWYGAQAYCQWQGKRLPTEAEWEKAARGTDGRTYPWGEGIDSHKAQYCGNRKTPVGTKNGVSPYGAYDMAGNVWEWVADWYGSSYYASSPAINPTGPPSGQYRVIRGGGWRDCLHPRAASRTHYTPGSSYTLIGFRCVVSRGQ